MSIGIDYDYLWGSNKIIDYKVWPTWGLMRNLFANGGKFLEIGSGNRPRIPIKGSYFVDKSSKAVENLNKLGAFAQMAEAENLPFGENTFDIVCAFEILEHVEDDKKAFFEISRVLKNEGCFLFSVPLGKKYWSKWDELAGHYRRYEPKLLKNVLEGSGFQVKKYTIGKNITVLQRHLWLGNIVLGVYKRFPKPFIFLEQYLVAPVVNFETKIGAFKGLKWRDGDFSKINDSATSATILCKTNL